MCQSPPLPEGYEILAAVGTPIALFDRNFCYAFANPAYLEQYNHSWEDLAGRHIFDVGPEDEEIIQGVRARFEKVLEGQSFRIELQPYRVTAADGTMQEHFWRGNENPLFGPDGTVTHIILTVENITSEIKTKRQNEVITKELEHRIRNTLAMVGSLAMVTGNTAPDIETFIDTFTSRLEGMSRSLIMISNNHWEGLTYRQVLCTEIAQVMSPDDPRIDMEGPDVRLSVRSSKWVALLAHEVVTNAVRYGCFSVPDGRLSLRWWVKEGRFFTEWQEFGPSPVSPPTHEGFGTKMMSMMPNTTMIREFRPEGLYLYTESILSFIHPDYDVTNQALLETLQDVRKPHE